MMSVQPEAIVDAGAKRTVMVCDPPACTVNDDAEVRLKPVPVTVAEITVKAALPVFETMSERSLVWPTLTFPNACEFEDKLSFGVPPGGKIFAAALDGSARYPTVAPD